MFICFLESLNFCSADVALCLFNNDFECRISGAEQYVLVLGTEMVDSNGADFFLGLSISSYHASSMTFGTSDTECTVCPRTRELRW